jgi:hypothetical protein
VYVEGLPMKISSVEFFGRSPVNVRSWHS